MEAASKQAIEMFNQLSLICNLIDRTCRFQSPGPGPPTNPTAVQMEYFDQSLLLLATTMSQSPYSQLKFWNSMQGRFAESILHFTPLVKNNNILLTLSSELVIFPPSLWLVAGY